MCKNVPNVSVKSFINSKLISSTYFISEQNSKPVM